MSNDDKSSIDQGKVQLERLVIIAIVVVLLFTFARIIDRVMQEDGSHDFHPYWYQGHAIRRGSNPYRAFLNGERPELPVSYLDGAIVSEPPIRQLDLSTSVTNTAPLTMLLALFSYYSWPVAKFNWMVINLILILFLPWLLLRSFPYHRSFRRIDRLLIILAVYAFSATRGSVSIGQTTLVVFTTLLGSLILRRRHWYLAGILLGIGLSKYSLAAPFVLFLLLELKRRNLYLIGVALLTQFIGILAITLVSGDSPLTVVNYYVTIFRLFSQGRDQAVQLGILIPESISGVGRPVVYFSLLLLLSAVIIRWLSKRGSLSHKTIRLANYNLLVILAISAFLLAYNGGYDMLVMTIVLPLGLFLISRPAIGRLSRETWQFSILLLLVTVFLLSFPWSIVNRLLFNLSEMELDAAVARMYVLLLLALLGVLLWLLPRLHVRSRSR